MRRHVFSPSDNEVDRWLDLERIANSELVKFTFFDNREYWSRRQDEDPGEWLFAALRIFALGWCFDLASAVAVQSGLSVVLIRRRGVPEPILHAAAIDTTSNVAYDILGARPINQLVAEMRAVAPQISISLERLDDGADHHHLMSAIAAGLPWMPRPVGVALTPFPDLKRLIDQIQADWLNAAGR